MKFDPGKIEQVIMDLAVNARDAMPKGGELTIRTGNVDLDEDYVEDHPNARAGSHVVVAVTDTGEGMDPETRKRIFEPFFTPKERGTGTGLGLSTVHGIVRQGSVDLLVSDVILPDAVGSELAGELQAEWPNLKVLYMSGYTDEALVKGEVLDQDTAYIEKPFRPRELLEMV